MNTTNKTAYTHLCSLVHRVTGEIKATFKSSRIPDATTLDRVRNTEVFVPGDWRWEIVAL